MLSTLWLRRCYSTAKRTIPYVTKGNWKLPPANGERGAPVAETGAGVLAEPGRPDEWGSRVGPGGAAPAINVPPNWRKIRTIPQWKRQMFALKEKFPAGWQPPRKLARDEMESLRGVKAAHPHMSNTELGSMFRISPEAVRRIVRSKWRPAAETEAKLRERWQRRGVRLGSKKLQVQQRAKPSVSQSGGRGAPRRGAQRLRDHSNDVF